MDNPYDPNQAQTLTEHLTELRDRIVKSAWGIAIAGLASWFFVERIFELVREPIVPYVEGGKLVFTNPLDNFMAHVKLAIVSGVLLSCPLWLYQVWMFIAPGLYAKERRYSMGFIGVGSILFLVGALFVYFLVLPTAFGFLLTFGQGSAKPMITVNEYMSFFMTMTLIFGAAFELPLILFLLAAIGLIDQKFLREKRRYAIVVLAAISAVVTPPDMLSMLMLLVPLALLYEISIIVVAMSGKKREVPGDSI